MATLCWRKGVVAVGIRQPGPGNDAKLMGTGFIVDLPTGLVSTCAHVVLDCFYEGAGLDPGIHGVAIGVGFGEQIRWVCRAEVLFISRPPASYDANACPGRQKLPACNALMGPQETPNLTHRTCVGCGRSWTGLPLQKGPPPSHWSVQDSTDERLDLAILRLVSFDTGSPVVDPGSVLAHSPGNPAHALRLGDSTALQDGEPLVMLGYGQEAETGVGQERTSTVTRGAASGGFTSTKTGAWLKTDAMVLSGHSGGPMVNRFGDVIGWAVQSRRMAELRPVESLLAPLELVLSSIAPLRQGPLDTLRTRLEGHATDRPELDDEALQACRAAMAGAETAAARAHHHEQGALAHTLAGASFRDDAARQAGAACSSAAQAASAAATACSAADAVNLLAQQQEKLVSIERDGAVIMCLLPSKHLQPITLPPSSTLAELRSSMADALEDSDLSPSFLFECKIIFQGQPVSVRIPRKVETKWTIAKVLPDEDSSPEVEHARWRRQLLPDLCQKDLRVELRMSDRVRDLLELGRGSFGIVREHELPASRGGGILAVKTIPKHLLLKGTDAEDAAREVRIHEKLAAKGVASTLYGVYEDTGSSGPERLGFEHGLHLVSHRADFDLHQLIVVHAPLPERFAATLCLELLRIVNTAHEVNVALVDVKPENFLLVATGASAVARDRGRPAFGTVPERAALDTWVGDEPAPYQLIATDFGLSQTFESSTRFSRIVGTPYYIAPEVVQQSYSAEADLWSIGVILHQLLTGSSLFEASSLQDSVQALVDFDLTRTLDASALASATISAKALLIQLLQVEPNLRATPADALGACRSWRKIAPSAWYHTDESIGTGPPCIERQASGSLPSEDEADVCRKRARDLSDGVEPTL